MTVAALDLIRVDLETDAESLLRVRDSIPREKLAEENSLDAGVFLSDMRVLVHRAEVAEGSLHIPNPQTVESAELVEPVLIEVYGFLRRIGTAVFVLRVLAPDDQRYFHRCGDAKWNRKNSDVLGPRDVADGFQRESVDPSAQHRIGLDLDVVDTEFRDVVEIAPSDRRQVVSLSRNGQYAQTPFESRQDLIVAVLAARYRNNTIVFGQALGGVALGFADQTTELLRAAIPRNQVASRECLAGRAHSGLVETEVRFGRRINAMAAILQAETLLIVSTYFLNSDGVTENAASGVSTSGRRMCFSTIGAFETKIPLR